MRQRNQKHSSPEAPADDSPQCWTVGLQRGLSFPSLGQLTAEQTVDANRHEGKWEELSLVEPDEVLHVQLPRFLHLFEILYKETEGENGGEAKSKEIASAHLVGIFSIEPQSYKEQ